MSGMIDGAINAICFKMAIVLPQCPCSVLGTPKSIVGIEESGKKKKKDKCQYNWYK
jgi:hypothetical protein